MISAVIPTYNAGAHLPRALAPLRAEADVVTQIVVADGVSSDDTIAQAEAAGCEVVRSEKGRARQLIAGARAAREDWLLFLHADTALAPNWRDEAQRFMLRADATQRAAAFRFTFDDRSLAARQVQFWTRLRGGVLKLPYGDQGLLISRAFYDALGGYRALALMEDVDLVRRIGARRLTILHADAVTSAEKYRRDGYGKRAWRNLGLTVRYLLGADPNVLAKRYD